MDTKFPSLDTPSIWRSFLAALWWPRTVCVTHLYDKGWMFKGRVEPMLIKASTGLGKSGEQTRKLSETKECEGSKHLMEWSACWANRLLQIEWSSRRLNRKMRNISSCSFQQLLQGKNGEEIGEDNNTKPAIACCSTGCFYSYLVNPPDGIMEWKKVHFFFNKWLEEKKNVFCFQLFFHALSMLVKLWALFSCWYQSRRKKTDCPSWILNIIVNNHCVRWGIAEAGVWQVH